MHACHVYMRAGASILHNNSIYLDIFEKRDSVGQYPKITRP